jgi:hypothetical protein
VNEPVLNVRDVMVKVDRERRENEMKIGEKKRILTRERRSRKA